MAHKIDAGTCVGCCLCKDGCPVEAITVVDGHCEIDASKCVDCGACAGVCPAGAITAG